MARLRACPSRSSTRPGPVRCADGLSNAVGRARFVVLAALVSMRQVYCPTVRSGRRGDCNLRRLGQALGGAPTRKIDKVNPACLGSWTTAWLPVPRVPSAHAAAGARARIAARPECYLGVAGCVVRPFNTGEMGSRQSSKRWIVS